MLALNPSLSAGTNPIILVLLSYKGWKFSWRVACKLCCCAVHNAFRLWTMFSLDYDYPLIIVKRLLPSLYFPRPPPLLCLHSSICRRFSLHRVADFARPPFVHRSANDASQWRNIAVAKRALFWLSCFIFRYIPFPWSLAKNSHRFP